MSGLLWFGCRQRYESLHHHSNIAGLDRGDETVLRGAPEYVHQECEPFLVPRKVV